MERLSDEQCKAVLDAFLTNSDRKPADDDDYSIFIFATREAERGKGEGGDGEKPSKYELAIRQIERIGYEEIWSDFEIASAMFSIAHKVGGWLGPKDWKYESRGDNATRIKELVEENNRLVAALLRSPTKDAQPT